MSVNESAAELLEKAADGFESGRYGWIRGRSQLIDLSTGQVLYCATGALWTEAGLGKTDENVTRYAARVQTYWAANGALAAVVGHTPMGVAAWNDTRASGLPEVIDKMKEAAKNLRNKEEAR